MRVSSSSSESKSYCRDEGGCWHNGAHRPHEHVVIRIVSADDCRSRRVTVLPGRTCARVFVYLYYCRSHDFLTIVFARLGIQEYKRERARLRQKREYTTRRG